MARAGAASAHCEAVKAAATGACGDWRSFIAAPKAASGIVKTQSWTLRAQSDGAVVSRALTNPSK